MLPKSNKNSVDLLFGTSGAGILIQEYIAKHGEYVSKVMLEATGAPDIAIDN